LNVMAIPSGLVSKDLPQKLLNRRKDIMSESVAYRRYRSWRSGLVVIAR